MDIFCPVCKEKNKIKKINGYKKDSNVFSLYQCNFCQVQFWDPRISPGSQWYEKTSDYGIKNILAHNVFRGFHKKFLKKYKSFDANTKVLELGCGSGEFLAELQKKRM